MDEETVISLHDPQGRVVWINTAPPPATADEVVGTYPWDWVVDEEKVAVKRYFAHCLALKEPQRFTATANVHGVRMTLDVLLDPTGGPALPAICRVRVVDAKISLLTPRDIDVLRLTGQGRSTKEIARALGMKRSTVDTHRSRSKAKLGLRTLGELVLWCARNLH